MISLTCFVYLSWIIGELEELFRKALAEELTDEDQILLQEVIDIVHRPERVSTRSLEFTSSTRSVIIETSAKYTNLLISESTVLTSYSIVDTSIKYFKLYRL